MINKFSTLGRFQFLVRTARSEGDITGLLRPMSIERLDRNLYPDLTLIAEAERLLMKRDGIPVQEVLAEVAARLKSPQLRETRSERIDRIKGDAHAVPLYTQGEKDDFESLREEA